ncbi:D-isomer specific 2-hydroxyacid dehydrogenase family protein [Frigoribacterium sp. VKM Ac-2836]|uniref:D-isomer specific 2-hydroxyacid dehydrogenase family protein n=1 Tax=Frigoribacterium sp. VKM Ac-2836 TaxID=2739014 RepID=UPI0015665CC2|nr:D-isomer specific 2-hydroxyacid dehydrogenase family protein [Frigoribacterium sp. VKM Ac-2836]NRD25142.1 hydroxyacid dehydrogenase [Frigoribacterium sp. VKM Ac-2836]
MSTVAVSVLPVASATADSEGASGDTWGVAPAKRAVDATDARLVELGDETEVIVVGGRVDQDELRTAIERNPGVRLVQLPSAGVDAYVETMEATAREGLVFTSAKGAYSAPVAEHALALTLATLRSLQIRARASSWEREQRGISLNGATVTIVGAGGIGTELLRLLRPFDVEVTMVRRTDEAVPGAHRTVTVDRLAEVLPTSDVVVVAAALTGGTRSLLGADEFAAMKRTAVLVNIARGPLVDTDALVTALAEGRIGAAGLDVVDPEPLPDGHPLWAEPRALITPHQANTNAMTEPLFQARVEANIVALAEGGDPEGVVDVEQGY